MSELFHYGTPRHSGRYPWGSGENPYQHETSFLSRVDELKKSGLSEKEISQAMGMSILELRQEKSIAKDRIRMAQQAEAIRLKDAGYSNVEIGKRLGLPDTTVGNLLKPVLQERRKQTQVTADKIKDFVSDKRYLDIGPGTELDLGVSREKLRTAVKILTDEGYKKYYVSETQLGTGKKTTITVLAPPDTPYSEVYNNKDRIHIIDERIIDVDGSTKLGLMNTKGISSDRIQIRYKDEGGKDKDGVIELRRGVGDISLGEAQYAQVRIAVDGTHFLKGMAMYADDKDMPEGVDVIFNTNKGREVPVLGTKDNSILKPMKSDKDNPFGASIKDEKDLKVTQRYYIDENGEKKLSAVNIVNEEGEWGGWSKNLSSQFLSKQNEGLAKQQLNLDYADRRDEFEEIKSITNPVLKKKLLQTFSDSCDSAAVDLQAAALPRQSFQVILPITSMKSDEVYAPNYKHGEKVALVRYPHGGTFEIPVLTVNNRQKEANSVMHNARDAIGINSKVAERLSGADFDGDTVLVIPVDNVKIRTKPPLEGLKDFDPKEQYKLPDGVPAIKNRQKQIEMGKVSNLITDMTLKGATDDEIVRAVKHSMVVIDAEKHRLDHKRSYEENGIRELKIKYQGINKNGQPKGAATLISLAGSTAHIPERKELYTPDPETGKKRYEDTKRTYFVKTKDKKTGEVRSKEVEATEEVPRMALTDDARTLISTYNTRMERIYADYANKMKAMGNEARKEMMATKPVKANPSAKKTYFKEVDSLNKQLLVAKKNAPRERQAQLVANQVYYAKLKDNPNMDKETKKKTKFQALNAARNRVGAQKTPIVISDKEWEAIQAGAISPTKLNDIFDNTDLDALKKRATPRSSTSLSSSKVARIKAYSNSGYSQAEIAEILGISASTVSNVLS